MVFSVMVPSAECNQCVKRFRAPDSRIPLVMHVVSTGKTARLFASTASAGKDRIPFRTPFGRGQILGVRGVVLSGSKRAYKPVFSFFGRSRKMLILLPLSFLVQRDAPYEQRHAHQWVHEGNRHAALRSKVKP